MLLTPGIRVGPYEIVAPLGSGGMGDVYRGLDTRLNRPSRSSLFLTGSQILPPAAGSSVKRRQPRRSITPTS